MNLSAIILMVLTMLASVFLSVRMFDANPERLEPERDAYGLEKPLLRFHQPGCVSRRDLLPMLAITAAYAAVAFWGLGDRDTPQSWQKFSSPGEEVVLTLAQETEPGRIAYFTGPDAGRYRLDCSTDKVCWTSLT